MVGIFTCVNTVIIFILLVIPGYFFKKINLIDSHHIDGVSTILVNLLWPAMVIDVMSQTQITAELKHTVFLTAKICLVIYFVSGIIFYYYWKLRKADDFFLGVLAFCSTCNNTGFIGMPYIKAALGNEALFIASIAELINDLVIFTIGIFLLQSGKKDKKAFDLKPMLSPGFISVFVGLFIFFFNIKLPDCVSQAFSYMSNSITAMAMFLVGAQLGEIQLSKLFKEKYCLEYCSIRLLLIPAVVFGALILFIPEQTLMIKVLTLMFAMPSASCAGILARQYQCNYKSATSYVMMSTILLMITLPIWSSITTLFLK